jgi:hypothetical protein
MLWQNMTAGRKWATGATPPAIPRRSECPPEKGCADPYVVFDKIGSFSLNVYAIHPLKILSFGSAKGESALTHKLGNLEQ